MKRIVLFNILIMTALATSAQPAPVKNVIVMIPDGTSTSLVSAARWYQTYLDSSHSTLCMDPYFRGLVRTHSSDAPIGDSAPTTSCYMTGQPTQTSFVSAYPVKTDHDLVPVAAAKAYQPLATLLEASKQLLHKSTGLVFTCEFPHATPADCAAHSYKRSRYDLIIPQMVHNKVDVVIGGGVKYLDSDNRAFLEREGYKVALDNMQQLRAFTKAPFWALFEPECMPYEMERDTSRLPSLAEMTAKAISALSQNPNGFFLMVEGSKIDWAAHDNDAKATITDFLAFDEACGVALDFARSDGNTLVVIMPDHGNSAITLGNARSNRNYDKLSLQQLMSPIDHYSISLWTMAEMMKTVQPTEWPALFEKYYDITPNDADIDYLQSASDYDLSKYPKAQRKDNLPLSRMLSQFLYGRTYFGFTTFGHTGENVFYAMYHPHGDALSGCVTNVQMHQYLCRQIGLEDSLPSLTDKIYADHHSVFKGFEMKIDSLAPAQYKLTVKGKNCTLTAFSFDNAVYLKSRKENRKIELSSVIVYMPKNNTFYLPKELSTYLQQ